MVLVKEYIQILKILIVNNLNYAVQLWILYLLCYRKILQTCPLVFHSDKRDEYINQHKIILYICTKRR